MLPLSGLRILTIEQYGAAPYCSMFLANMGAEVIKIENPSTGGDFARSTGPFFLGEADSLYFQAFNLNKNSLTLDIKSKEGKEIIGKLVGKSDAIVNNLRGNQVKKLGLDYKSLSSYNKKIVCGHISAYGRDNSRADWPGYDYLMQAESGFLSLTGEPDGPPARFGLSMVDFMTGMMLGFGVLSAIIRSNKINKGCDVDVNLMEAALHQLTYPGIGYLNEGLVTGRIKRGAHPSVTPSQLIKTKDGWVFIMCQNPKFWDILIDKLNNNKLNNDKKFIDIPSRLEYREELTVILDEIFSEQNTDYWIEHFKGQIPIAPVYNISEALDNDFLSEINMINELQHPENKKMKVLNNPIRINGERLPIEPGPKLGNSTNEILKDIGYNESQINILRKEGKI
ncbi:MAG: CoA transferase [Alphaproteobacteria bacterium TMED87]|nr:CoA transferase [Rhodospirillaceae bacterium]OUV11933.1 MAG: CoA transferase [Alphaproteobacteria bacterium TMED87]